MLKDENMKDFIDAKSIKERLINFYLLSNAHTLNNLVLKTNKNEKWRGAFRGFYGCIVLFRLKRKIM